LSIIASLRRAGAQTTPRAFHPNNLQERANTDDKSESSSRAAMPPSIAASSHGAVILTRSLIPRLSAIYAIIRREPSPYHTTFKTLARRQIAIIPSSYPGYPSEGPAPGAVAGITLGAVAGFLLLIILIYYITNGGGGSSSLVADDEIVVRRSRTHSPPRRSRKSQSHRSSRQEVRTIVRSRSPRAQRITVEERTTIIPGPPPPRPISVDERIVEERIVEERRPSRRVDGDDIVEVIEEEGSSIIEVEPPRRDRRRRSSGYRSVDPNQYGGGDYPQRPIRTRRPS
jgi:hypothetical protein